MADMSLSFTVTPIYIGLHVLLAIVLAWNVIAERRKGEEENADAIFHKGRVHANFVEYVPLALLMIGALELMGTEKAIVHVFGAVLFASRLAHAWGFGSNPGFSRGRFLGTLFTWIVMAAGAVWLIVLAVL